jgi:hypothetical protein
VKALAAQLLDGTASLSATPQDLRRRCKRGLWVKAMTDTTHKHPWDEARSLLPTVPAVGESFAYDQREPLSRKGQGPVAWPCPCRLLPKMACLP